MVAHSFLTDDERFPAIRDRELLERLREHEHAPRFNLRCGDRLSAAGVEAVREYERGFRWASWRAGEQPEWVQSYAEYLLRDVPLFRRRGGDARDFSSIPTTSREDVAREPWSLVPDSVPLDDLIVYYTSGASGSPMDVLAHPEFASKRLVLFRAAFREKGIELEGGSERVSIVFVCSQQTTLTYASLSSFLGGAGHVKVNLNPSEWRHPDDRQRYLDELDPEVYSGDPLSLADLAELPLKTRPKALVSSAMTLLPATRKRLEAYFGCPIFDFYSSCESGPIAVSTGGDFRVLPHDLYVEIVDREGRQVSAGERGEIALTGGRNPFLPLLRYRTGDFARMECRDGGVYLCGLEGRAPVVFQSVGGRKINNIDVTTALRACDLPQFAVHQNADLSLIVRLRDLARSQEVATALRTVFGESQKIRFETIDPAAWKVTTYSRT